MYSAAQLQDPKFDHKTAITRFLHKFHYHRNEFRKFKVYEKHYVFEWMRAIYKDNGESAFDLYEIEEAKEYLFYYIILCYGEDIDEFSPPLYNAKGKIPAKIIRKDKRFFNEYLDTWKGQIKRHKGPYLDVIVPMLNEKLRNLKIICSEYEYKIREKYCYAVFFYLYYRTRLYFDGIRDKCITFSIQGYTFVINTYSFCHIFNRHYVPSLNKGFDSTMNNQHDGIDIRDLPLSLRKLIIIYFSYFNGLSVNVEYLLFEFNGFPYILWIKYKNISELHNNKGFEVRSYYRCEEQRDLDKFTGKTKVQFSPTNYLYV